MSDCNHGQPEWAACPKCIDEASERMGERIRELEAENTQLRAELATATERIAELEHYNLGLANEAHGLKEELTALREREPVAWRAVGPSYTVVVTDPEKADSRWEPLYLAPQPAIPEGRAEETIKLLKEVKKVMKADSLHRGNPERHDLWQRITKHYKKLEAMLAAKEKNNGN